MISAVAFLLVLEGISPIVPGVGVDPALWRPFDEATERAAVEQRPLLVYVQAAWCGPCRLLERAVFPEVASLMERYVLTKLDYDDHDARLALAGERLSPFEWSRALGAKATPTIVLLAPDGTVIVRSTGYRAATEIGLLLAYVATGAYRHATLDTYLDLTVRTARAIQ